MIMTTPPRNPWLLTWPRLLRIAAVTETLLLLFAGAVLRDPEALVFGVVVGATTAWIFLRSRSRVATVIRLLVFADVELFMLPAAVTNIGGHESLGAVLTPLALAITSAVGIVATAAGVLVRSAEGQETVVASALALAAGVIFLAGTVYAEVSGLAHPVVAIQGALQISAHDAKFSTTSLRARSGQVTVYMTNNDLFWHTFTVQKLGVSMAVPIKGHRTMTFSAAPGTYQFMCSVPGHAQAGMRGTLTVTP